MQVLQKIAFQMSLSFANCCSPGRTANPSDSLYDLRPIDNLEYHPFNYLVIDKSVGR